MYAILRLSRGANSEEIRQAYRALVKQYHPDVNAGDLEAEQRIKEINRAYETLIDPEARAAYDLDLARYRAKKRRGFWRAVATGAVAGAVAFMLTVATLSVTIRWRQSTEIHQLPGGEPTQLARNASSESLVAKPPAEDRTDLRVAGPRESARGDVPRELGSVPLPGAFGEHRHRQTRKAQAPHRGTWRRRHRVSRPHSLRPHWSRAPHRRRLSSRSKR